MESGDCAAGVLRVAVKHGNDTMCEWGVYNPVGRTEMSRRSRMV